MRDVLIGRRYRLTEEIGSGGMANVYRAVDETLGRSVAVKVMHARLASDSSFAARFQQEAKAAANLQSPYVVKIYDWGHEVTSDGQTVYYIVMDYVRGTDLKSLIEQQGALASRRVAEIGAQVCSALAVAHGYGVIHRDIKPHNIMVSPSDDVTVMDFGIARAGNTTMTQTGSVLGSAHYVSPEQAQGRELTAASDLYSLGVVLYEAATGVMPFDGDTPVATALKQVQEQPLRPSAVNPQINPGLEQVIGFAMAKDPRARYATADAMRRDLLRIAHGEPVLGANGVLGAVGAVAGVGGVGADDATRVLPGGVGGAAGMGAGGAAGGRRQPAEVDTTTVMPQVGGRGGSDDFGAGSGAGAGALGGGYRVVDPQGGAGRKKSKAWVWVLVVALLLAAAGVLAWQMGWLGGEKGIRVPNVVGMNQDAANQRLDEANLGLGEVDESFSDQPVGTVIEQRPEAGAILTDVENMVVNIVISKGPEVFPVPDLTGRTVADAQQLVSEYNFKVVQAEARFDDTAEVDTIIEQDPTAETELPGGSTITVTVSKGVESVTVPDVVGQTKKKATALLKDAGFAVNPSEQYSTSVKAGSVIEQNPRVGASLKKGDSVDIVISLGPEIREVTVPTVTTLPETAAKTTLENSGLKVTIVYEPTNLTGSVISQNPAGGKKVKEGTTVTIVVDDEAPQ